MTLPIDSLLSLFKPKKLKTLFVDKSTESLPTGEQLGIILSPSYYWVRLEALPAKNVKQAKELAFSVFDTIIPQGEYRYEAIEVSSGRLPEAEKQYLLFAYEPQAILQSMQDKGAKLADLAAFWFAQTELVFEDSVKVDEKISLIKSDLIVNILATPLVESQICIQDLVIVSSKHKIQIESYDSGWLDKAHFHALSIALIFLIGAYLAEFWLLKKDFVKAEEKKESVLQKYSLPPSSMQIKAILAETRDREYAQLKVRDNLLYVSNAPLVPSEQIGKLELVKNSIIVALKLSKPDRAEVMKTFFKKRFAGVNMQQNGAVYTFELKNATQDGSTEVKAAK